MSIDRDDFLDNVRSQFDQTEPELIQLDTDFETLDEWCSLVGLGIMAMIHDKYGVKIPLLELTKVKTVENLYDVLSRLQNSGC